jgi:AcrR family transcriptional regulator
MAVPTGTAVGTGRGRRTGAAGTELVRPTGTGRTGAGRSTPGRAGAKPNRRGVKSRELVLDAAERVMAEHGYQAATIARVVEEAGIPLSSVYHYFGSKEGILLAVMERGADRFFADLPPWDQRAGRPAEHLAAVLTGAVHTLERHPHFLRLLIVLAAQPPAMDDGEVQAVIGRIRGQARQLLRAQIGRAFGDDPDSPATDQLARFALAAIDGAFLAWQADQGVTLERLLQPLPAALPAARRALLARAADPAG